MTERELIEKLNEEFKSYGKTFGVFELVVNKRNIMEIGGFSNNLEQLEIDDTRTIKDDQFDIVKNMIHQKIEMER